MSPSIPHGPVDHGRPLPLLPVGFLQDFRGAARISTRGVKSVGDAPDTGQVLTSYVQQGNVCTLCTGTATLELPRKQLTLHGAQIY